MSLSTLWPRIGPDLAHEILAAVQKSHKKMYGTALEVLAPRMKLRPAKVLEMPKAERHAAWAVLLAHPQMDPLSQTLLGEWLAQTRRPMMEAWLDTLGIAHDGRGFLKTYPPCPEEGPLRAAFERLLAAHPPADVLVYLAVFNAAPEARWPLLAGWLDTDPRLPLRPA
jgi:hypothetical protein